MSESTIPLLCAATAFRRMAAAASCLLACAACASLPDAAREMETPHTKVVEFEGARGPVSASRSAAVIEELKSESGDSDILQKHLAFEQAINIDSPLVLGNRLVLLQDGPATYQAMFAAMRAAKDHINLETYIFEDDDIGKQFSELLLERQAAGVQVNLIYDSVGCLNTPKEFFDRLRAGGIQVLEFNPVNPLAGKKKEWLLNNRDHRKLLVVDGRVAFIGGVNISSVYSTSTADAKANAMECWRDTHVRIEGPVVAELQQLFLEHWRASSRKPAQPANYFPSLAAAGAQRIAVAACDAGRRRNPLYRALLAAIDGAERRIFITSAYFVPTRRLIRRLIAAARRGVDVRLALPGVSDVWAPLAAGRATYGRLLSGGVRIFERHNAMLHAKTVVIDGVWATVGSSNMDWRSLLHNAEANVVIVDRDFGTRMEELFDCDLQSSAEVTLQRWRERGWTLRLSEWFARKLEFLL